MKNGKLKIAIVVHGRFYAFELANELIKQKHDIIVFTNYPKYVTKKFGIPYKNIHNFCIHGIMTRIFWFLREKIDFPYPEAYIHKTFGRWASKMIAKEKWDIIYSWSGVSEEILKNSTNSETIKILVRGSSHIRTQNKILSDESNRTKTRLDLPSSWMISREEKEYALADYIQVLSSFAYSSFIEEGINRQKLLLIFPGVSVSEFRPLPGIVKNRYERILNRKKLRVLYVGTLSFRKGMWDMADIIDKVGNKFEFCLVGPLAKENKNLFKKLSYKIKLISKQPQSNLARWYSWADLFLFPTVEDGYPAVLVQAQASGLPILTTTNCSGPDIITEGKTGHVFLIRRPEKFIEKLLWYNINRKKLKDMAQDIYENVKIPSWNFTAKKFIETCKDIIEEKKNV